VGTAMHLIALLGLKRSVVQSYDVDEIQAVHDDVRSAQSIYVLMQEEIRRAVQQDEKFDDQAVRELLRKSDKVPKMGKRSMSTVASMIEKLVEQQT
jgi:hypothetical protein